MFDFPELSRAPDPDEGEKTIDPTLRDPMENGDSDTALRFTRGRREWDVKIQFLTLDDKRALDRFVREKAVYGSQPFRYLDTSQPTDPEIRIVKFAALPEYKRTEKVQGEGEPDGAHRYHVTFTLREE